MGKIVVIRDREGKGGDGGKVAMVRTNIAPGSAFRYREQRATLSSSGGDGRIVFEKEAVGMGS